MKKKSYLPQYRRTTKANWRNISPLAPKGFATKQKANKVVDFYKDAWKKDGLKVTGRFRVKTQDPTKKRRSSK